MCVCVWRGGGGGRPYISHTGMYRPKGWGQVWRRFGLKKGIDFAHFGLESGTVYEGFTVYERVCHFNSK